MTTRGTVEAYFAALSDGGGWQEFLSESMTFVNHAGRGREATGRDAYVESTRRFFSMVRGVELQGIIVEGNRACATTRYRIQPPAGEPFPCDVAEILTVKEGFIDSLEIYFDSAPFSA